MPKVDVGRGVELAYEVLGEGPPLLLIMGFGAQLIHWPDPFVDLLVKRGFQVIRFDNRDAGLSSKHEEGPRFRPKAVMLRGFTGLPVDVPYTLWDMSDDVAGLLDALKIDKAHVVGASMGGMIGQCLAIRHRHRLKSFTSIMSHPGTRWASLGHPKAMKAILAPRPADRAEAIERGISLFKVIGSPDYPADDAYLQDISERAYDRCYYPHGSVRQMAAISASGDRRRKLGEVNVPTLVIHGDRDPLIRPVGGRQTAKAIPNARLEMIEGMGHDLPAPLWGRLTNLIADHADGC